MNKLSVCIVISAIFMWTVSAAGAGDSKLPGNPFVSAHCVQVCGTNLQGVELFQCFTDCEKTKSPFSMIQVMGIGSSPYTKCECCKFNCKYNKSKSYYECLADCDLLC